MSSNQEKPTYLLERYLFEDGQPQFTQRLAVGEAAPATAKKLQALAQQLHPFLETLCPRASKIGPQETGEQVQFLADLEETIELGT
ncbi:hypothetical protein G7054_g12111 [Neopestalotiopsis clavispora]|nr:hypothetical protein G7054_g12111 [Neopestalotiopsis clavispora]